MPRIRCVTKLETLSLNQFCKVCASTCTLLEESNVEHEESEAEVTFKSFLLKLPRVILERVITSTLTLITSKIRKNRSHKGLTKAIQCLPQKCVQSLDLTSLYSQVRLYGNVNWKLKDNLAKGLKNLPNLIHLNLSSKASDEMLVQLAKHCPHLEVLSMPLSDVTDNGLLALAGLSFSASFGLDQDQGHGCFKLTKINVTNCVHISEKGVACLLRNLQHLQYLYYDKLMDALETVIKVDPKYLQGQQKFDIRHIDQFGDFYNFDNHPGFVQVVADMCPQVESFRFYIADRGCSFLQHFNVIKHLQLEISENLGRDFDQLIDKLNHLVSLQLTFRNISGATLVTIAKTCANLEILRLIGYQITGSENMPAETEVYFSRLKVLEIRVVKSDERLAFDIPDYPEDPDGETADDTSISPSLLSFFLSHCLAIQDITISASLTCLTEEVLMSIIGKNPMTSLQSLCLSPINKKDNFLTASVALNVIMNLPNLNILALSRWKMTSREMNELRLQLKSQNYDLNFL